MNEEKAARILAKELGDKIGKEIIIEDSYKDNLIKNSLAVYQIGAPVILGFQDEKFHGKKGDYNTLEGLILEYDGSFAEANYYFLENLQISSSQYGGGRSRFTATPYTLIGKKEEAALRKMFYKNVNPEIAYAMNTLGINNFIDFYKSYKESLLDCPTKPVVLKVLKEDLEMVERFIDFAAKLEYDSDEEVPKKVFKKMGGIGLLNARLERLGMTALIESSPIHHAYYVHRSSISNVVKQLLKSVEPIKIIKKYDSPLLNEFIDFVFFSLPYEEQNVESNKCILKSSQSLDFITAVLSKEYSNGKYFQDYFDVLGKEAQDKVVESLKVLSDKKPVYDSFLWSKGFKGIDLDYVSMYKDDANTFIDYFSKRSIQEKKVILKDIMNCDSINEDVADWLNQNEPDLLREVGFNG